MITPLEIENKEFSKSMRGYNAEEVDEFLDEIYLDLQELIAENEKLKAAVDTLNKELEQCRKSESSVLNTLESAKKLMNDISESAEKRAEIIIRNAQMDAEVIQRDARDSVSKLTEEGEKLKGKVSRFRERYRQMLEDELSQLEGSSEDLFADLEKEFLPASMDENAAADAEAAKRSAMSDTAKTAPLKETVRFSAADTDMLQGETGNTHDTVIVSGKPDMSDTMVVTDRSLEEILRDDFGFSEDGDKASASASDLTRTRIVK
ncbi:MAG: DivIVA domain-containing protein [Emergencia sp.]